MPIKRFTQLPRKWEHQQGVTMDSKNSKYHTFRGRWGMLKWIYIWMQNWPNSSLSTEWGPSRNQKSGLIPASPLNATMLSVNSPIAFASKIYIKSVFIPPSPLPSAISFHLLSPLKYVAGEYFELFIYFLNCCCTFFLPLPQSRQSIQFLLLAG